MTTPHRTDRELITEAAAGDDTAFTELVARYRNLAFGVAYHHLQNFEDARDVSQNAFLHAYMRLGQLRHADKFGPWLRQIVENECRAWHRRQRPTYPLNEWLPAADDGLQRAENRIVVQRALERLDEHSRLTIALFYLQAYSMREIAEFLEEPVTTIKSRLRNARAKMRKELEEMAKDIIAQEALPHSFAERVTEVIEAARTGDGARLSILLEVDRKLAVARNDKRSTALHAAAGAGNTAVIDLLLTYGADVNARDEGDNATPLHYAAERGHLSAVERLVEAGSDVNATDDLHERGPLGWAATFSPVQTEAADYLIEHGARYDIFSAIGLDRPSIVRDIAAIDPAVVNAKMSEFEGFRSAIVFAMSKRRTEIANILVELGAETGVDEAVALGRLDLLTNLSSPTDSIESALRITVECDQVTAAQLLLEHGASADSVHEGRNTLFVAIGSGYEDMARLLLSHGADLEFRDATWNSTPLGWAVFFANVEAVRLALNLGAKVDPALADLVLSGERGELRSWSSGSSEAFRRVGEMLLG